MPVGKEVRDKVTVSVLAAVILGALALVWNWLSSGGLVIALGGVPRSELDSVKQELIQYAQSEDTRKAGELKTAINAQFARLRKDTENGMAFSNTEPDNNGGGYSPDEEPARCATGSFVVGVQPYKYKDPDAHGDRLREIRYRCAFLPELVLQ